MNGTRLVVWIIGVALVVFAIFLLFFQTGLSAYVPAGIALAGLILIVGVIVMSAAEGMHSHEHVEPPRERIIREENVRQEREPVRETHVIERGRHY